jgi:hypothetical protein
MKLEKKEIDKIIKTLTDISNSLVEGQYYNFTLKDITFKEKVELPHKWAIKAGNQENAKIIYPYLNKQFGHGWGIKTTAHYDLYVHMEGLGDSNGAPCQPTILAGYEEITLEQFKEFMQIRKTSGLTK